jgi:hypothetical protein
MSPSSDIETLFGHFGGNPGDYQEIGRENEASSARTRWPLLVTLDLKQPSIPAIAQRREPASKQPGAVELHLQADAQAAEEAPQDGAAAAGSVHPEPTRSALLRSKAPLFTRPHRRSIPAVGKTAVADVPRGAERFSALPEAHEAELAPQQAEAAAVPVTVAVPGVAAPASTLRTPAASAFSAKLAVPSIARPQGLSAVVAPVASAMPAASPVAVRAAAPAAAQPPSILGKLFAPAARESTPSAAAPAATESTPAPLGSLFARLRGDAVRPAAPAPHSWLTKGPTKGPRRS